MVLSGCVCLTAGATERERMADSMKSMVTAVTVMAFLFVLFRKKLLPFLRGKKKQLPEKVSGSPDSSAVSRPELFYDVLLFDTACYESYADAGEHISTQLTRKMQYVDLKGSLLSMNYIAAGSLLVVVVGWTEG